MGLPTGSGVMADNKHEIIFNLIVDYKRKFDGRFPTYEYLGQEAGCSKSTAWYHVERLISEGRLERNSDDLIIVVGGEWTWHNSQATS